MLDLMIRRIWPKKLESVTTSDKALPGQRQKNGSETCGILNSSPQATALPYQWADERGRRETYLKFSRIRTMMSFGAGTDEKNPFRQCYQARNKQNFQRSQDVDNELVMACGRITLGCWDPPWHLWACHLLTFISITT